ncbi:MAG: hypothetical protein ACR2O6_00515 [Ilumatobacteraceae bacterium]
MRDPREGITAAGTITTGASRERVPAPFEPVVASAVESVTAASGRAGLYLYGSVATGQAVVGSSDVDLVAIGLDADRTGAIASELSERFAAVCRGVDIGAGSPADHLGDDDEAYGNRVFLRHYCVHLAGPDHRGDLLDFPADRRAARGFNGDIARHAAVWRTDLDGGGDPAVVGRRLARKSLLTVAGLVSVRDGVWTTDRATAADAWSTTDPDVSTLLSWAMDETAPTTEQVALALDGPVARVVTAFEHAIGVW